MSFLPTSKAPKVSHDSATPEKLLSFMLQKWKAPASKKIKPIKNAANFKRRREELSKHFPGELLLIPTGHLKVRANDTFYSFRPCSDFLYLTGNSEPDCVLALVPNAKGHEAILFVEPNPGKSDSTFFTDRVKGELWEGARFGIRESADCYGISARGLPEMNDYIDNAILTAKKNKGYRVLRKYSTPLESKIEIASAEQTSRDQELATFLSEMRLLKDAQEVAELVEVIRATKTGFEDVIRRLKSAKNERELEGVFFTRARTEGNDVGYGTIVASGHRACTLHWKKNDGALKKGEMLLLDAGVEGNSFYTADITRTLPINGRYTKEQKEIYELVLAAQKAALKQVKPGIDFMAPNRAAMDVLAYGLEKLGILPMTAAEALKDENQFYKRYSLHNVSHMLGLDVHDCAQARAETYKFGNFKAGMVLTVEPGLYFQIDDLTVPAKYRGIGVRIEDDVLVTKTGVRNLSANIPKETKDVEAWMKKVWKSKA